MYNKEFKLSVRDIQIIENALIAYMLDVKNPEEIQNVLAKLHHQKVWYRPNDPKYVGG